ncbi:DUF2207 domain-containing protein [Candidatus Saccharibacteria bacterium]|nr:DUF2207 domain-containing protein [Candidatus Saccharibacteria bacterium]
MKTTQRLVLWGGILFALAAAAIVPTLMITHVQDQINRRPSRQQIQDAQSQRAVEAKATSSSKNWFTITDFDVRTHLERGEQNQVKGQFTETITAEFPTTDQNHGLERYLPARYDNRSLQISDIKVTDTYGREITTEVSGQGSDVIRIRAGDKNTYVHGKKTYVFHYTVGRAVQSFDDIDEFYWNLLGPNWAVPIQQFYGEVTIDKELIGSINRSRLACYFGEHGKANRCGQFGWRDEQTLSVAQQNLRPFQGVTVAVAFTKGTVGSAQLPAKDAAGLYAQMAAGILAIFLALPLMYALMAIRKRRWRKNETRQIVREFIPPKESVWLGAHVARLNGQKNKVITAQILDLTVRGYLVVKEVTPAGEHKILGVTRKTGPVYAVEIVRDLSELTAEELAVVKAVFNSTSLGARYTPSKAKRDTNLGSRIAKLNQQDTEPVATKHGYFAPDALMARLHNWSIWFILIMWFMAIGSLVLAYMVSGWSTEFTSAVTNTFFSVAVGAIIVAIIMSIVFYSVVSRSRLTDKGVALTRYMYGLRSYMQLAEAERIRFLQSPENAQRVGSVNTEDPATIVKLYERLLPYAALFGMEKGWMQQLAKWYETTGESPVWSSGIVYNAAFISSMNQFMTTDMASGISGSVSTYSSSSSGGSSGGGFSGGGAGGGGGGGW